MLRAMVVIILLGLLGAVVKDPPQSVTQRIPLHSSIDLNGPEPELIVLPTERGEP